MARTFYIFYISTGIRVYHLRVYLYTILSGSLFENFPHIQRKTDIADLSSSNYQNICTTSSLDPFLSLNQPLWTDFQCFILENNDLHSLELWPQLFLEVHFFTRIFAAFNKHAIPRNLSRM